MIHWGRWLLSNISRETTSGQFIPEVDGLRFIAISSVILFHLLSHFLNPNDVGQLAMLHYGVELFFIISGAVIALPFAKGYLSGEHLPQLKKYYVRRLTRLEPPYLAHLLILFLLLLWTSDNAASTARNQFPHLLASMGYLHNSIYGTWSSVSSVAWSLEVEFQFYILAPLISTVFMIQSKHCRRLCIISLLVFFALTSFLLSGNPRVVFSILYHMQFFLAGFLLVDLYIVEWKQIPSQSYAWDILSVAAWLAISALACRNEFGRVFIVVPMFIACCGAFRGVWGNRFFRQPFIYIIGGMCYTLYLYHSTLIYLLVPILPYSIKPEFFAGYPVWLLTTMMSLITVPLIVLVSAVFFIGIEKPCMKRDWHIRLIERFRMGRSVKRW